MDRPLHAKPLHAKDVMITRLVTLRPEQHVFECISRLVERRISGAPVIDDNRQYLGVFSEKCCMGVLTATARSASESRPHGQPVARDFMATKLITLTADMDVFEAIGYLLKHRISGAPVIDADRRFLGSFSEKTSMRVLIDSAVDQLPTATVGAFMNTDTQRVIHEDLDVLSVAEMFIRTPYRRLPVLRDGRLVGQVSRRDVLKAGHHLARFVQNRDRVIDEWAERDGEACAAPGIEKTAAAFMDTSARTIAEDLDLLGMAQLFLTTPYRRLPVVRDGRLVGQVSRRDVLVAAHGIFPSAPALPERKPLYLSSLHEMQDAPIE